MVPAGATNVLGKRRDGSNDHNCFNHVQDAAGCCVRNHRDSDFHARNNHLFYGYINTVTKIAIQGNSIVVRGGKIGTEQACCCCNKECCQTVSYSYMDTEPKGKWYDECPTVGLCGGAAGSCANAVLEGFIIERFCKSSVQGKQIKATLRKNSTIDDFGSVAGIATDEYTCGQLGKFTSDHDITEEVVFEDDPDDPLFLLAKVAFTATNANHGGPYGLSAVRICWCCIEEGDPPCACCTEACTNVYALSGGVGTTTNTYTFPSAALSLEFKYDAYNVPDAFTVKLCGDTVVDTGSVSGSGKYCLQKPAGCQSVEVTVVGPDFTAWGYTIKCVCDDPPPPRYGCVDGECVRMEGGPYGDPTCGGECADCATNADCGCVDAGYTYYSGLDEIFPGFASCPPGTYFSTAINGCWSGSPGTETAAGESKRCCGGECVPVVQYSQGDCLSPADRECPGGCCPENTFVCCPDGYSCAPCPEDCPNQLP